MNNNSSIWRNFEMFRKVVCFAAVLLAGGAAFGAPGDIAGLEAWFDGGTITEGNGVNIATWSDSSGNGRDGINGISVFTQTPPAAATDTIGTAAGSRYADFDGGANALEISNWNHPTGAYTILVLARTTDGRGYLVGNDINGVNNGDGAFGFGDTHDHPNTPNSTGELALTSDDGTQVWEIVASGDPNDADGSWHIYAVIVDVIGPGLGANVTLNIDGVDVNTGTISADGIFNTTDHPVTIGSNWGGGGANGLDADIAQVLIYSGALSADDFNDAGFFIEQTYGLDTAFGPSARPLLTPTGGSTDVFEGGVTGDTIEVTLGVQPVGTVEVEVREAGVPDINDPNILVFDLTLDGQAINTSVTLSFDDTDWDIPQAIAVDAFDDSEDEDNVEIIQLIADVTSAPSDPDYVGKTGTANVNVSDNDGNDLVIVQTDVSVVEGGATDQYDISLTLPPSASVLVNFTDDSSPDQVTIDPNPLVFGIGETGPKTATVSAVDDGTAEAHPHQTTISHSAFQPGGNQEYNGKTGSAVTATIGENDCGPENGGFNQSDFNQDCLVDLSDLLAFGLQWLECSIESCD
jgi:hypothetical protein